MYYSWLDRWDEHRAQRGDDVKETAEFMLDAQRGFPGASKVSDIEGFCKHADQTPDNANFFSEANGNNANFELKDGWLKFHSNIPTDVEENNVVWAKITNSSSFDHALIVFHHWNASYRQRQLANYFSQKGITVVEIAMPYHFERSRAGSAHADYMLSPNLGRTIQSIRQAVCDGRRLISWLKNEGYEEISVLGMSLGSWVAGLVAAHDASVSKASLFLTAGSLADMVWTGRATRLIHQSFESQIELTDLRRAWGPINLENYSNRLARPDLDLQVVLAERDKVVLPELSQRFLATLNEAGAKPDILKLNCGHYSLGKLPYILIAGLRLKKFLQYGVE